MSRMSRYNRKSLNKMPILGMGKIHEEDSVDLDKSLQHLRGTLLDPIRFETEGYRTSSHVPVPLNLVLVGHSAKTRAVILVHLAQELVGS